MKAGAREQTQHRPDPDGYRAQPKACESPSSRLLLQSTQKDQVRMLAVPKAQFRIDTHLPRNHPPRRGRGAEASSPGKQVRLQANPCAGSLDGMATLSDRAVRKSRGCLRPAIAIDTSQMQGNGGYIKGPHPWLVVHTSGRLCAVSTHPGLNLLRTPRHSKDYLGVIATEWEAVWEPIQAGAHFFVHSATGHAQWNAPQCDDAVPTGGKAHTTPAKHNRTEQCPPNDKGARKKARSNETDWSRVSWSDL